MDLGYKRIGKTFSIQSSISVFILAMGRLFVDINPITNDKLLIAAFGSLFIGTSVGLVIRGGDAIDGAEVLSALKETGDYLA